MYPDINVRDASDWFYRRRNMQEQSSTQRSPQFRQWFSWSLGVGKEPGRGMAQENADGLQRGEFWVKNNFCNVTRNKKDKIWNRNPNYEYLKDYWVLPGAAEETINVTCVKTASRQSLRPNKENVKHIHKVGKEREGTWFFINKLCEAYIKFSPILFKLLEVRRSRTGL